ncbi:MAG: MBL fold metallo-hydrolase, partial [Bdellovibrionales bacterium]|nr:MBL fold metallo-hydrolase [Bdellovibrionales bacterium]
MCHERGMLASRNDLILQEAHMGLSQVTFLGHSACLLEYDGKVIAIDPWLSGNPSCPDTIKNPGQIDLIVLT